MDFITSDYIESLIGYADEVVLSENINQVIFTENNEMQIQFKEDAHPDSYSITGFFMNREILFCEDFEDEGMKYLLGDHKGMLTVLVIDEKTSTVKEFPIVDYEILVKKVKEDQKNSMSGV